VDLATARLKTAQVYRDASATYRQKGTVRPKLSTSNSCFSSSNTTTTTSSSSSSSRSKEKETAEPSFDANKSSSLPLCSLPEESAKISFPEYDDSYRMEENDEYAFNLDTISVSSFHAKPEEIIFHSSIEDLRDIFDFKSVVDVRSSTFPEFVTTADENSTSDHVPITTAPMSMEVFHDNHHTLDSTLASQRSDNTPSQAKLSDLHRKNSSQDSVTSGSTIQPLVLSKPFENESMYRSCYSSMIEGEPSSSGVEVQQSKYGSCLSTSSVLSSSEANPHLNQLNHDLDNVESHHHLYTCVQSQLSHSEDTDPQSHTVGSTTLKLYEYYRRPINKKQTEVPPWKPRISLSFSQFVGSKDPCVPSTTTDMLSNQLVDCDVYAESYHSTPSVISTQLEYETIEPADMKQQD
jgi:hypothetical protein